jgi:hypothetical protein
MLPAYDIALPPPATERQARVAACQAWLEASPVRRSQPYDRALAALTTPASTDLLPVAAVTALLAHQEGKSPQDAFARRSGALPVRWLSFRAASDLLGITHNGPRVTSTDWAQGEVWFVTTSWTDWFSGAGTWR